MLDERSIATLPRIGTAFAKNIQASQDARYVAFLWSERGDEYLGLWVTELATGRRKCLLAAEFGYRSVDEMPAEVELLRERIRQRSLGVLAYAWVPRSTRLLVPRGEELLLVDAETGEHRVVARAPAPIVGAKVDPTGTAVAFGCRNDLWLGEGLESGSLHLRPLTSGGGERLLNGVADFLAQEELSRYEAFWWHPQGKEIAFVQTDLSWVPTVGIPARRLPGTDFQPYAFAGASIGTWRLGTVRLDDPCVHWLPVDDTRPGGYLARAQFEERGRLLIQVLNRKQDRLWLLECSPGTGTEWRTILEERSEDWVNVPGNVVFGPKEGCFIWLSTGGGENRIQVREIDGNGCESVPTGDVRVDGIIGVGSEGSTIWFHGRKGTPENRFVFRTSLDGNGSVEAISERPGWHDARLLSKKGIWVYTYESVSVPPTVEIRGAAGEVIGGLPSDPRPCENEAGLPVPEFIDVSGGDGISLRGCLYRPRQQMPASGFPLLVAVYGGPGVQSVRNAWDVRVDLRSQRFCEQGVLVLKTDNRGSSGRGRDFERRIGRRFGSVDVEDQVRGVRYVADELKIADPDRVAVSGWSYGGYLAAMCLLSATSVFKAAVAGAPVVSWRDYDACYTERYMGTPEESPEAYARADLTRHVAKLAGRLLIIHGMRDENVLFAHTARLAQSLNASGASYDLLLLPEERHSVRSFDNRVLLERRVFDHVMAALT